MPTNLGAGNLLNNTRHITTTAFYFQKFEYLWSNDLQYINIVFRELISEKESTSRLVTVIARIRHASSSCANSNVHRNKLTRAHHWSYITSILIYCHPTGYSDGEAELPTRIADTSREFISFGIFFLWFCCRIIVVFVMIMLSLHKQHGIKLPPSFEFTMGWKSKMGVFRWFFLWNSNR